MKSTVNFPTEAELEKINPDRREIIKMIKTLLNGKNPFDSTSKIFLSLAYPELPFTDETSKNASKIKISRIIGCADSPTNDELAGIKYSDLLEKMKIKFAQYITKKDSNSKSILPTHSDYYIYYYESYSEKKDDYLIKFAIVGFDRDAKLLEWKNGNIYYLNEYNQVNRIFLLKKIVSIKPNSDYLFFSGKEGSQVNFYTLKVLDKRIDSRGIIPLTYSVLETQHKFPCAGKAILEKTTYANAIDKIKKIGGIGTEEKHKGVSETIINSLFHHKYVLKDIIFDVPEEFSTEQARELDIVKGIWSGVHLRTDFDNTYAADTTGGLCKFILNIKGSGECDFYWDEDAKQLKTGFIEFPFGDTSIMKINLEYLKKERTYKLILFLSAAPSEEGKYVYKGVISGWVSINRKIYTSAIYMTRISKEVLESDTDKIMVFLKKEKPKRISKEATDEINNINIEYLKGLRKASNEFQATFINCMPKNFKILKDS